MEAENKFFETGTNPYHLNLNNTAKEFSFSENTNPEYGLLNTLSEFIIVMGENEAEPIKGNTMN